MTIRAHRPAAGTDPLPRPQVPLVLMYHRIGEVRHDPHHLAVTPRRFARQMATLARLGLRAVSMAELVAAIRGGTHRRLVGLTFDDGYADLVDHVPAVLHRHRFGATVFVVSGRLGGVNDWDVGTPWPLVDADGVRRLADAGLEIGSHGRTHRRLAGADPALVRAETYDSRLELEALVGRPVTGFAYPYGSMDPAARSAVGAAGYAYGCAVFAERTAQSLSSLPRVYVGEDDGAVRLAAKRLLYRWHVQKGSP
ncbi:MAG: polysaccharide deacetylase family protein [Micromonospora sp.]